MSKSTWSTSLQLRNSWQITLSTIYSLWLNLWIRYTFVGIHSARVSITVVGTILYSSKTRCHFEKVSLRISATTSSKVLLHSGMYHLQIPSKIDTCHDLKNYFIEILRITVAIIGSIHVITKFYNRIKNVLILFWIFYTVVNKKWVFKWNL